MTARAVSVITDSSMESEISVTVQFSAVKVLLLLRCSLRSCRVASSLCGFICIPPIRPSAKQALWEAGVEGTRISVVYPLASRKYCIAARTLWFGNAASVCSHC